MKDGALERYIKTARDVMSTNPLIPMYIGELASDWLHNTIYCNTRIVLTELRIETLAKVCCSGLSQQYFSIKHLHL